MSKKLTTNTFVGGLQKDFHPLTVPADVLTDALNATIVTMNGNEGILQNDMGNGRVESAFLPPGYVPVGVKEYGGIIYVASYNPITNKGLIGSFPSPERNIDLLETGDPNTKLDLLDGLSYTRIFKNSYFNNGTYNIGIAGLTNKIQIFLKDMIIRSGDKFGFYFTTESDANNVNLLSNYDNCTISNNLIISRGTHSDGNNNTNDFECYGGWDNVNNVYRNNIVTLNVQVLDSNNNLRDITPLLKRYNITDNSIIKLDLDISDVDKFNLGYFISKNKTADWDKVNEERNKSALNTYNNKLFGKLFLTGTVNTIDHIEHYIKFEREIRTIDNTPQEFICITFCIDYYYNCPKNYLHTPKIIYDNGGSDTIKNIGYEIYDSTTNLYKRTYEIKKDLPSTSGIVNYIIIPTMKNLPGVTENTPGTDLIVDSETEAVLGYVSRLTHIAVEGSFDLLKIGTGFERMSEWRYRYLEEYMLLNVGIEYYPLETDKLSGLKLTFYDWNLNLSISLDPDNSIFTYTFPNKISYNGTFTAYLDFNAAFVYGHLYIVKISITKNGLEEVLGYKWLISTEIYNDLFSQFYDYCDVTDDSVYEAIYDKNAIKLNLNIKESNYSSSGINSDIENINCVLNGSNLYDSTSVKTINSFVHDPDSNKYGFIKFYNATTSEILDTTFNISTKFPFHIQNPLNLSYKVTAESIVNNNQLEQKVGLDDLPIGNDKKGDITTPQLAQNNISDLELMLGNAKLELTTTYNFPSELVYSYKDSPEDITPNYIYKRILDFAKNELNGKDCIFPIVGVRGRSGAPDDLRYIDLLLFTPGAAPTVPSNHKELELIESEGNGILNTKISLFQSGIKNWMEVTGIINNIFCIVGSPILFGWDDNTGISVSGENISGTVDYDDVKDTLLDILDYQNDDTVDINFYLKPYTKLEEKMNNISNTNFYTQKMYYWAYLLWKDKNGNFVTINRILRNNLSLTVNSYQSKLYTSNKFAEEIFNPIRNLYFKQSNNNSLTITVHKIKDSTYNLDYIAKVYNLITSSDINLKESPNNRLFCLNDINSPNSNATRLITMTTPVDEDPQENTANSNEAIFDSDSPASNSNSIKHGTTIEYRIDLDGTGGGGNGDLPSHSDIDTTEEGTIINGDTSTKRVYPPITNDGEPIEFNYDDPSDNDPDGTFIINKDNSDYSHVIIDINTISELLGGDALKFLTFYIDINTSTTYKTKEFLYVVPGLQDLSHLIQTVNNYGALKHSYNEGQTNVTKYYFSDINNSLLNLDFYLVEDGDVISPILNMNEEFRNFVNKLIIQDDKLLVNSVTGVETSNKFGFSAGSPHNHENKGVITLKIGDRRYIDLPSGVLTNYTNIF